jgi:hypothetical protein
MAEKFNSLFRVYSTYKSSCGRVRCVLPAGLDEMVAGDIIAKAIDETPGALKSINDGYGASIGFRPASYVENVDYSLN